MQNAVRTIRTCVSELSTATSTSRAGVTTMRLLHSKHTKNVHVINRNNYQWPFDPNIPSLWGVSHYELFTFTCEPPAMTDAALETCYTCILSPEYSRNKTHWGSCTLQCMIHLAATEMTLATWSVRARLIPEGKCTSICDCLTHRWIRVSQRWQQHISLGGGNSQISN